MRRLKGLTAALALGLLPFAALADERAETALPVLEIDVAGGVEGMISVQLRPDLAPDHVARIIALAEADAYDNVVFHRVIEGFMAQTGDVQYGVRGADTRRAGMGGSELPDLQAEFTATPFERGVMGMARAQSPHSANSQFFLMFAEAPFLNGQYTVLGEIIDGFDVLDSIKLGRGPNGAVLGEPDYMADVRVVYAAEGDEAEAAEDMAEAASD
ncbi:peptidylprolyl isomerase [Pararhodobacter oceanensis]|uniref:Peptidyl-prolyl cis-trans isomerase n=1 Tax=Pararhodobacter oceanensis TaxID=2172121 RepID=A0A2T8HT85_9RHOB|nr:peptidylprolyl isomerase [Pararhodobacter oceanensis]PVH28631.1 peptidylprolyl isomerase [Pararhodobacter oceanensis]